MAIKLPVTLQNNNHYKFRMDKTNFLPLSDEQLKLLTELTNSLSPEQINWVSGYFTGLSGRGITTATPIAEKSSKAFTFNAPTVSKPVETSKSLTILYGSRTGNGEGVAKQALKNAIAAGFDAKLKSMESYKNNDLKGETNLLVIVSTHGEGEPPFQAKTFHEFLHSKRAPRLEGVNFAVLALGDSSYLKFCQTGVEFDSRLEELGAKRILPRVDCDVNFRGQALQWITDSLAALNDTKNETAATEIVAEEAESETNNEFGKHNPFKAQVLEKTFLHGRDSNRQTIHVEMSLEDSGLTYEPGDSLGVYATNPPELVEHLLQTVNLSPTETVKWENDTIALSDTLFKNYELTQITPDVLTRYEKLTGNDKIKQILTSHETVKEFIHGKDLVDLFTLFPEKLSADQFVSLLRPIQPRLYSISSSPLAYPDEVHLTVGVVKYKNGDRKKTGLCSVFLSDRTEENESAPVFVEKNNNFRLPENPQTPIIMVGAGTGVAPYRAFIQHRELDEKRGKSWLIFGNRHSESEFLYQLEWQRQLREGSLTRLDVAFSRDSDEKVYVQDRIREQGKLLYDWLENGAHFYVCGDMKKMAHDVNNALLEVIQLHGALSKEAAEAYVLSLQHQRRYQTDVY
jgi:sulfite reductase (NADPH) flavoprotein alpha-component